MTNSADPDQKPTNLDLHCLLKGLNWMTKVQLDCVQRRCQMQNILMILADSDYRVDVKMHKLILVFAVRILKKEPSQ